MNYLDTRSLALEANRPSRLQMQLFITTKYLRTVITFGTISIIFGQVMAAQVTFHGQLKSHRNWYSGRELRKHSFSCPAAIAM